MASNNGYLTHCRICGTPIFSLGNRQFCSACYAQNRRNAAHRSNAEAKMRREQAKREEEKMKASNKTVTSAQELAMRAKLSEMGGISYGELSLWEMSHGLEFSAWEHEWDMLSEISRQQISQHRRFFRLSHLRCWSQHLMWMPAALNFFLLRLGTRN